MKFLLGANYWGRDFGTEMWLHYNGKAIRTELKQLAAYGIRYLRVFPNWRDFQPVDRAYAWRGRHGEYVNSHTGEPVYGDGVDAARIADFRDFCRAAEENGISLVVSVVTGWMSGKLFVPPVLNGKNLITDPEALMWMRRFVRRFVKELKNEKAILVWDLGNECNCMGEAQTPYEAYNWTATVADAIRTQDTSRPISSGMHSLESDSKGIWQIEHQGELCDLMTPHPYPSPTVGGDREPYTRLRMTYLPTAQALYYAGVAKKPAYIQESGTFSETIGNRQMAADFMRIQILSALANGLHGYQWWCAWEQEHLNFPPYTWAMMERQLGLFDKNGAPKPVALEMQKAAALLEKLPNPFPQRKADGVCILTRKTPHQSTAIASLILGKQAGIDLDVAYSENGDIPEADLYFMPAISGWQVLYKKTWDTILERVQNGATLCISYDSGHLTDFSALIGAYSSGLMTGTRHTLTLGGETVTYGGNELLLTPTTAQVLLENEENNPVLLKNSCGKGNVYFINFAPETIATQAPDGFYKFPFYLLYRIVAQPQIEKKPVYAAHSDIGVTVNPERDGECVVTVLNYGDKPLTPDLRIADGYTVKEVLYGDLRTLPPCDGLILRLTKA